MHITRMAFAVSLLFLVSQVHSHGDTADKAIKTLGELRACVENQIKRLSAVETADAAGSTESLGVHANKIAALQGSLQMLGSLSANPDALFAPSASELFTGMMGLELGEECQPLLHRLIAQVNEEIQERQKLADTAVKEFESELGQALLQAETAQDIDPWFARVVEFRKTLPQQRRQEYGSMANHTEILTAWQDYLVNVKIGNIRNAEQSLTNLSRMMTQHPILPRSEIIQRQLALRGLESSQERAESADPGFTLDLVVNDFHEEGDLGLAIERLTVLANIGQGGNHEVRQTLQSLQRMQEAETMLDELSPLLALEMTRRLHFSGPLARVVYPYLEKIRRRAVLSLIPEAAQPTSPDDPLERVIAHAASELQKQGEWLRLWEFLNVVAQVDTGGGSQFASISRSEIRPIETYLHARRLEEAGSLASALTQYERVLSMTSIYGPQEAAIQAIERLRGPMAEALLADQKREAETPRPPAAAHPGMARPPRPGVPGEATNNPEIRMILEEAVDARMGPLLEIIGKKVSEDKSDGDQGATE